MSRRLVVRPPDSARSYSGGAPQMNPFLRVRVSGSEYVAAGADDGGGEQLGGDADLALAPLERLARGNGDPVRGAHRARFGDDGARASGSRRRRQG